MDALKSWAVTVCAAAVICAALDMLIPEHKYERVLRLCLAAFALCTCIAPLCSLRSCGSGVQKAADDSEFRRLSSSLQQQLEQQTADAAREAISRIAKEKLAQLGFPDNEIAIKMDIAEDSGITIGQVAVTLRGAGSAEAAAAASELERYLGLEVAVHAEEANTGS